MEFKLSFAFSLFCFYDQEVPDPRLSHCRSSSSSLAPIDSVHPHLNTLTGAFRPGFGLSNSVLWWRCWELHPSLDHYTSTFNEFSFAMLIFYLYNTPISASGSVIVKPPFEISIQGSYQGLRTAKQYDFPSARSSCIDIVRHLQFFIHG